MDKDFLYLQIANSLRNEIMDGVYKPGDTFPPIRNIAETWKCTIGTVQRAFQKLTAEGLVTTHIGKGTKVLGPVSYNPGDSLRRANIIHRVETFLLEILTEGYDSNEVEESFRVALERWKAVSGAQQEPNQKILRFSGSHDLAVAWLATHFGEISPGYRMQLEFSGSLPGLVSLSEGKSDIAGSHLWDDEKESYNTSFLGKVFPDERIALITLAHRRIGWLIKPGNPKNFKSPEDLIRKDIHFVNRNPGSGTRIYLDSLLKKNGIDAAKIWGYFDQKATHSEIAATIAEDKADAGLGLEAAARSYNLDFVFLNLERYDLIVKPEIFDQAPIQNMISWLKSDDFRLLLEKLGGYEHKESGHVRWS